ncbi:MAG: relaxase domain-containing protein [Planctomycetes bacterium]|nr:relaxase domain-containing protein [Planctomycetota bacterium]MBI3833369.1 relaxase domain-containing protein [Planctomycetota bacterium]
MLSIAAMGHGQVRYYLELAQADYYLNGGEPPGQWWGKGAEALGLSGRVERSALEQIFSGFSPDGALLIQNAGSLRHQPGWDLTFSAPKSVSTVWSQSDENTRRAIQVAHFAAVKEALAYLEDEVAFSRRGKDGVRREHAKLIVATFEHATSRALDPQPHTHCLVMNAAVRPDGTTGTILSKPIYKHKMVAGALYRVGLATRLTVLGLECEPKRTWFEVKGVSQSLIDEFSKRRKTIEALLGSHGMESASAAAFAALATREPKTLVPPRSELFAKWREVGIAHGYSPQQLTPTPPNTAAPSCLKDLVQRAANEITEQESHFSRGELLRRTAELSQTLGASVSDLRTAVSDALASPRFVHVGEKNDEARYTTHEMLTLEKSLLDSANKLSHKRSHAISARSIEGVLKRYEASRSPLMEELKHHGRQFVRAARGLRTSPVDRTRIGRDANIVLSAEQAQTVRHITRRGSLAILAGVAGSGKTAALTACREIFEKAGYHVIGGALAAKAARELQKGSGIRSGTLRTIELLMKPTFAWKLRHHLLQLLRAGVGKPTYRFKQLKIDKKTVLIIDEANMVGTRQMARFVDATRRGGGKLVLVGDRQQLQAIEAGAPFAALADRHEPAKLTKIIRQREEKDRKLVQELAKGNAKGALKDLAERGLLTVAKDRSEAMDRLVTDWADAHGHHSERALIFCGTNVETEALNLQCQDARLRAGRLSPAHCVRLRDGYIFEGDRVLLDKNSRPLGVHNGDLGTVVSKGRLRNTITVALDDGRDVVIPLNSYPHVKLGYAVTTHKGQGTTVEDAFVLLGGFMQHRELSYTQASRARGQTRFYTDEHEAGPGLANLARQMSESRAKELAVDLARQKNEAEIALER